MHFNRLKLSCALEVFYPMISRFWVQKCKNQPFEEKKHFGFSFYRIDVQMNTNPSSRRLEKKQKKKQKKKTKQILEILLNTDFL